MIKTQIEGFSAVLATQCAERKRHFCLLSFFPVSDSVPERIFAVLRKIALGLDRSDTNKTRLRIRRKMAAWGNNYMIGLLFNSAAEGA